MTLLKNAQFTAGNQSRQSPTEWSARWPFQMTDVWIFPWLEHGVRSTPYEQHITIVISSIWSLYLAVLPLWDLAQPEQWYSAEISSELLTHQGHFSLPAEHTITSHLIYGEQMMKSLHSPLIGKASLNYRISSERHTYTHYITFINSQSEIQQNITKARHHL